MAGESKLKDARDLHAWCKARLDENNAAALRDPLATGVRRLTVDLLERLEAGDIDAEKLRLLSKLISDRALSARAKRLAAKSSVQPWSVCVAKALAAIESMTPAEAKKALESARAGVVFTAHPTFAMSRKLRAAVGKMASADASMDEALADLAHAPDPAISLADEHEDALAAIGRAQEALRELCRAVIDRLAEKYPRDWADMSPTPVSLATWVGYDLDGRTDIHWGQTFRIRLHEKALQLGRYAETLAGVDTPGAAGLGARLRSAAEEAASEAALFAADLDDADAVVAAANRLTANGPQRLVSLQSVIAEVSRLIGAAGNVAAKKALCVLRAEMRNYGLGVARIHLRVNAAQVRSAVKADLGLDMGRGFLDRTALDAAAEKSAHVAAQTLNFGSVFLEKMTARRQLMLAAQLLKHVDADAPIRFLIAEAEAPATIMAAIYLARLYGVDHRLDISPLFETPDALERAGRFMERLLDEDEFIAYIKNRGRVSIQLGFSDSGRFMGQVAAAMAIERAQILLSRALAARRIRDVEVVIFNTHGESMGRGGHPGSFRERLDHLMTPWTRARFAHDGLRTSAEMSFQGGDGFLHFETPALAAATVQSIFAWAYETPAQDRSDAFYSDINFSWDAYRAIKGWQEGLFASAPYQAALSTFGPNLLPTTGSRKVRRQSGASKDDIARSLRAIPHNAILQQLAAPANVLGGMGSAAAREPERFAALVANSPRMALLLAMADAARRLTSLSILRTYASLYSPSFWTIRAARSQNDRDAELALLIADRLAQRSLDVEIDRLANVLSSDRRRFDALRRDLESPADGASVFEADIGVLHAIRLVMIVRGFMLAASTPGFSPRHELARETLIDLALDLRFADVADLVEEIFPASDAPPPAFSSLAEKADPAPMSAGYPEIRREIAAPLRRIDQTIEEISVGVAHFYDAYG